MSSHHTIHEMSRQDWEDHRSQTQEVVNGRLDQIGELVEVTNDELLKIHLSDPEKAARLAREMAEDLNLDWRFHDDTFLVSGSWYKTTIVPRKRGLDYVHEKVDVLQPAISKGFIATDLDDIAFDAPQVCMSFKVGTFDYSSAVWSGKSLDALTYAQLKEVSLQYLKPGDTDNAGADLADTITAIHQADSLLNLYTNHEGSNFYDLKPSRQHQYLKSVADLINDAIPPAESTARLLIEGAKTPTLYLKNPNRPGLIRLDARAEIGYLAVTGQVVGGVVHDQVHLGDKVQFSSPADIKASEVGPSLVVRPTEVDFSLEGLNATSDIIIPIRPLAEYGLRIE